MMYEIGAILILLSTIPQMIRTYKNRKNLRDISPWWLILGFIGASLLAIWALQVRAWLVLALEISWAFYSIFTLIQLAVNRRT